MEEFDDEDDDEIEPAVDDAEGNNSSPSRVRSRRQRPDNGDNGVGVDMDAGVNG
jgi:hypothetical protein